MKNMTLSCVGLRPVNENKLLSINSFTLPPRYGQ